MENRAVGGEVLSLVEQLVQRALHDQAGPPASARDTVADRLAAYSMSLLGSRMSASPPSELALTDRLCRALTRVRGADAQTLELRELLAQLRAAADEGSEDDEPALADEHRVAALQLLAELAGSARSAVGTLAPAGGALAHGGAGAGRFGPAHGALASASLSASEAGVAAALSQRLDAALKPSRPSACGGDGGAHARSAPPPPAALHGAANGRLPIWAAGSAGAAVREAELVRAALYAMQAVSSRLVAFGRADGSGAPFAVDASLLPATRELLGRLCELGVLFSACSRFASGGGGGPDAEPARAEDAGAERADARGAGGFVRQALCAAVRRELDDFLKLLAILDAERHGGARRAEGEGGGGAGQLTLRKLLLWAHEPRHRLETMRSLIERCAGEKGGGLANALCLCGQHGDPLVRSYVGRFAAQAGAPLLRMLCAWLLHGSLEDSHAEFFVGAHGALSAERGGAADDGAAGALKRAQRPGGLDSTAAGAGAAEALWHSTFALRSAMLPAYISAALATRVLLVGKSVRLLRECAPPAERSWVSVRLRDAPALAWGEGAQLEAFVQRAADAVHPRVRKLVLEECGLLGHLRALRSFLLLSQGDFVQHLMACLAPELGRPAHELHRHSILALVDGAVRASTASADFTAETLARLDVRLRALPHDEGWAAFSLDYHVADSPVAAVVTAESLRTYRRLFHFVWRLKRAEYVLASVWTKHTTVLRLFRDLHASAAMRAFQRLRHELLSFVANMQYHAMAEVLEGCWAELLEGIGRAADLRSICGAHSAYLAAIVEGGLFLDVEAFTEPVRAITEVAFQFAALQTRLHDGLLEADAQRRARREREARNTAAGRWASIGGGSRELRPISEAFEAEVEELRLTFYAEFDRFFGFVSRHPSARLASLAARLDFNGFHAARNADGAGALAGWTGGLGDESPVV